MKDLKIGAVLHSIYENDDNISDYQQDELAFLHSHGVDYGDLTADGRVAQLVIT